MRITDWLRVAVQCLVIGLATVVAAACGTQRQLQRIEELTERLQGKRG